MKLLRWPAVLAVAMLLAVAGCTAPGVQPAPSESPSPSPTGYGIRYVLPAALCSAVNLAALKEIYPDEELDNPLRLSSTDHCDTTLRAGTHRLGLEVYAFIHDDVLLRDDPKLTREQYDGQRARAPYPPTQIDGVGSGAFWYTDGKRQMWFETYDGNLNLRMLVYTLSSSDPLDSGMPNRLATVAKGTLAALRP